MKSLFLKMKVTLLVIVLFFSTGLTVYTENLPDEGMWLPLLLERLNYIDMQKMGLHLTADELYSINNNSLKDAIVGLSSNGASGGFFCTAELVSSQGLIFTNHHCGYNSVQSHSTTDHDYLTNGFWAKSMNEELSNESMCASFLQRIENVTDSIIPFLSDTLKETDRANKIKEISSRIKKRAEEDGKYEVSVKSFYGGNEFYLFVFKTYKDVRLVGAPPSSIGKFGGDTDNWMWPRHTGDFTVFRVYTDPEGNPAKYSEKNIPLKPAYHLPISLKGIQKNDFAMIWGYPGNTSRYLTSYGIEYNLEVLYPTIIKIFGKELEVMKERMDADKAVKIAYADNYAGLANTWKNFIGQSRMLIRNNVEEKKKSIESDFQTWYSKDPSLQKKYGKVLDDLQTNYTSMKKIAVPFYYSNIAGMGLDLVQLATQFNSLKDALEKKNKAAIKECKQGLKSVVAEHFKEYDQTIAKKSLAELLRIYANDVPKSELPSIFTTIEKEYKNDFTAFADAVYQTSAFATPENANNFIDKPNLKVFKKDLGWLLSQSMMEATGKNASAFSSCRTKLSASNRLFIAGLREMNPALVKYPDANSTMRMTYGSVLDYYPADAVHYDFITTLKGVMQKEDPTNEEFIVEKKLKDLYQAKDYGQYGQNGEMVVCFLTTNDITGGNSGSPVINGDGQLIGLAFDGNWEAMSGDIMFEPDMQRTINVDIRYVLFIIDKFAGATNLINELTLVK
ncbi:MAG: S46 family peptidase [Bacteroidales bacterium]|nr:S46 family peptidase [Bacteroidales bacterium]